MRPLCRAMGVLVSLWVLGALSVPALAWADEWEDYQARHPDAGACGEKLRAALEALGEFSLEAAAKGFAAAEEAGCATEDGLILAKMAFLQRLRHDDGKALAYYRKALPLLEEQYPDHAARVMAYYNLGYLFEEREQGDQAVKAYDRALEIDSNFTNARTSLKRLRIKLARKAIDAGELKTAVTEAEAAVVLQAELDEGLRKPNTNAQREALLLAVEANLGAGKTERAGELSQALLVVADGSAAQGLGTLWSSTQSGNDWALKAYRKAADLMPERAGPLMAMGQILESQAQWAAAAKIYVEAAGRSPGNADIWYALGVTHFRAKKIPEARKAFEGALAADPGHAEAREALGQLGGAP